jgi:hypothetical protein
MHSHGFHGEFAQDRQSQLLRDAGVGGVAASHLAEIAAGGKAEVAGRRQRVELPTRFLSLNPTRRLALAWSDWRRAVRVRPRMSGV